ncbi:MAG: GNAT family N-acetyltransferase [Christensenellales bacterium]
MTTHYIAKSSNFENIILDVTYEDEKNMYLAVAKTEQNEKMGYINFSFNPRKHQTWLWKIETYEPYQHQGVATALLSFMESESISNRNFCIEGKFHPSNDYARPFYEKFGYDIDYEDYSEFIWKSLCKQDTIPFTKTPYQPPEEIVPNL